MLLKDKIVFITGATSGFGLACAKLCAAEGAKIIATGRREDRLKQLERELKGVVHMLKLDVRDNDAVVRAVESLPPPFAAVDILVNNAGGALGMASYEHQKMADVEQMVETNIQGVLYCTHALLPGMIARNRGHIVNISSTAANYPYPGGNVYGAAKAFVSQFSLNLRADLLGTNIRVTSVEPGMAETEFSLVRFHGDKSKADAVYQGMQPLTADDIAETILWCVSRPMHVNVNRVELMPTQQAFAPFAVNRDK